MTIERPGPLTLTVFGIIAILGGLNAVGVHYSNRELAPFWGAFVRFATAAVLVSGIVLAKRYSWPRGRALLGPVLYGVFGFGFNFAFIYWGILEVPPGLAQLLLALVPLLTLFLAIAHGVERFRFLGLAGGLLALTGIAVIFRDQLGGGVRVLPMLAVVAGAVCFAESNVVVKRFPRNPPAVTTAIGMITGSVILLALSVATNEAHALPSQRDTWIALAFLVLGGSVGLFIAYVFVLNRWTASATSYLFILFPFVSTTVSSVLTGEAITLSLIVGGALVLGGVYVGALMQPRHVRKRVAPEASGGSGPGRRG